MQTKHLEYFLKAAETENLTRAAEELYVSQPSFCRCIRELEQELGIRLFERKGRRKVLTEGGRLFLPYARRMAAERAEAERVLADYTRQDRGEIRIAGTRAFPGVAGILGVRYYTRTGNTGVRITETEESPHLILTGEEGRDTGEMFPVYRQNLVLLVPPGTGRAGGGAPGLAGDGAEAHRAGRDRLFDYLERHPFLAYPEGSGIRVMTDRFFRRWGLAPDIALETADEMQLSALCAAGAGCAILPEEAARYYSDVIRRTDPGREPAWYGLRGNVPARVLYLGKAEGPIPACASLFCRVLQGCKELPDRL